MSAPSYVHAIDGRLRVKLPVMKGSAAKAARIADALEVLPGIRYVKANPTTGNVLVLFDPRMIDQRRLIEKMIEMSGFAPVNEVLSSNQRQQFSGRIAETLVQSAVQMALERVILALV
jgi:copper chaperone CopZ